MTRRYVLSIAMAFSLTAVATAQSIPLAPGLSGISFLVGTWGDGAGNVADTGGRSRGSSAIVPEVGGSVLIRRDHTDLFDNAGKPTGDFDQIMMIYPEGGTIHADYSDGRHIIHYTSAVVVPGHSVIFATAASPAAPSFRLRYELSTPDTLAVTFETAAPGQTTFQPIANGTLHKKSGI